jgi:hypothetical protein
MTYRMSRSLRRGTVALIAAVALLVSIAQLQPDPTPSALARTGSINIGTRPPS